MKPVSATFSSVKMGRARRVARSSEAEWAGIDADIFARRIIDALAKTQARHRCPSRDALQRIRARYDLLRAREPGLFKVSPEEYWEGFGPLLRRRSVPPPPTRALRAASAGKVTSDARRRKGERRILVDGVAYFWRVPRRTNSNQYDQLEGVFAVARRADGSGQPFKLHFPQPHPAIAADGVVPVLPSDIARAIREPTQA